MRVLFALALLSLVACGPDGRYALIGSVRAESVMGEVQAEYIEGGQLLVTVELAGLPSPERVEEGATHYIVWMRREGEDPVLWGALERDLETRVASLARETPHHQFTLVVTAESSEAPSLPSAAVVTEQSISIDPE